MGIVNGNLPEKAVWWILPSQAVQFSKVKYSRLHCQERWASNDLDGCLVGSTTGSFKGTLTGHLTETLMGSLNRKLERKFRRKFNTNFGEKGRTWRRDMCLIWHRRMQSKTEFGVCVV